MMDLEREIEVIQHLGRRELCDLWRQTFGEEPRSGNVPWMRRRLAWGVQAQVLGGLPEAAQRRIEELRPIALASMPWGHRSFPKGNGPVSSAERGCSVPKSGTVITR